jgi:hypothetical protein
LEENNYHKEFLSHRAFLSFKPHCPLDCTRSAEFGSNENNKKGMVQKELTCTFIDKFAFGLRSV